jgi:hypothetical protein
MFDKLQGSLRPLVYLSSNWISLIGVVFVTTAGILWIFLLPSLIRGSAKDPYLGILQFMVLPAVFFAGLALIPLGIWWFKKRNKDQLPSVFPPADLNNPQFRRLVLFLGVTTVFNLVIGAHLTFKAVHYMESVNFCGQTCHVVMKPEFTAYQNSPHSRVDCVNCHIGPGANWFVKSKISGSWQVISVSLNLYPRPIPTPIENLRPARETCEICHWPQKYGGDVVRVLDKFANDEVNKHTKTVLLMHIGGGNGYRGIHGAHMGPGITMRYGHSDKGRQTIPWVEYAKNGDKVVYKAEGFEGSGADKLGSGNLEVRTMDCIDCHNRPSHTFEMPDRALNEAFRDGKINGTLPFARKTALEILKQEYATTADAEREIPRRFAAFYEKNHPSVYAARKADIERGGKGVLAIFSRNIFPEMRVKWGSYPNNLGHTDFNGCFRCHDYREGNVKGRSITQDCETCHKVLAEEEENPKALADLGLAATGSGN